MKAPLSWLKEFVEIACSAEQLAERLTFSGLEVESVSADDPDLGGIIVAEILGVERHPNAENLSICRIHDGRSELQVVCGALNFAAGDKAAFAAIGATLPGGRTIEPASIRGVSSEGMLCAEDELGLSDDHSGLMLLPPDTPRGKRLSEIMGPPDPVLNIEVTPNRADCLSIIGIAREAAALLGKPMKLPHARLREAGGSIEDAVSVQVEDPGACPRYTARILSGIKVRPSPLWVRRRLMKCGIRPINNVVDVTNYVMLETGQPLHAFDISLLKGKRIVVRRAKPGERIKTLDEAERDLTSEMLVIADAREPVALAGVMGAAASGIVAATQTVLLESACFHPPLIRRTSKALGLASESSSRFEHGVDIMAVERSSRRAAALLSELAEGVAAKGVIDIFPIKPAPRRITCRFASIRKLLGVSIPASRIADIFKSLELKIVQGDGKTCSVQPPSFRMDLEGEADLAEEVARIYGLDRIPTAAPKCSPVPRADDSSIRAVMLCKSKLAALGLTEIMNYSFVSENLLNLFEPAGTERRVSLMNPISADQALLRNSLLPQMGETLRRNCARQAEEAALFEVGRVFSRDDTGALLEEERMALGLMGQAGRVGIGKNDIPTEEDVFLWAKGVFESFCRAMGIGLDGRSCLDAAAGLAVVRKADAGTSAGNGFPLACFENARAAFLLLDGATIGVLGLLKNDIRSDWRLRSPAALLEARLEPLISRAFEARHAKPAPAYPSVNRDVAIVVPMNVMHKDIVEVISKIAPKELTDIRLFDIYYGKELGTDRKGMAYSLRYRSPHRTLTDEEVNDLHSAIKAGIRNGLKAEIREG